MSSFILCFDCIHQPFIIFIHISVSFSVVPSSLSMSCLVTWRHGYQAALAVEGDVLRSLLCISFSFLRPMNTRFLRSVCASKTPFGSFITDKRHGTRAVMLRIDRTQVACMCDVVLSCRHRSNDDVMIVKADNKSRFYGGGRC